MKDFNRMEEADGWNYLRKAQFLNMKLSSENDCCCEDNLIHDAMFTKQEQGDDDFAKDFAKAQECPNGFVLQTGKPEDKIIEHGRKLYWQMYAA